MTFVIVVGVFVVVALGLGLLYDRKHRRLGDSSTGGITGGKARQTKLDGRAKGSEWTAGM